VGAVLFAQRGGRKKQAPVLCRAAADKFTTPNPSQARNPTGHLGV
jgi:hypothetical protein